MIYQMVTGTLPFDGATPLEIASKRLKEAPAEPCSLVRGLDAGWNKAILKSLGLQDQDLLSDAGRPPPTVHQGRVRGQLSLWLLRGEDAVRALDRGCIDRSSFLAGAADRGGLPRFVGRDFTPYLACGVLAPRLCPAGLPDLPGRGARPLLLQVPRGVPLLSGSSMFRAGGDA